MDEGSKARKDTNHILNPHLDVKITNLVGKLGFIAHAIPLYDLAYFTAKGRERDPIEAIISGNIVESASRIMGAKVSPSL